MFETTQSLAKAHIWLVDVKKCYFAFLNPNKGYDEPTHEFSRMKDVFDSNYSGGAYNSFKLLTPAFFQYAGGTWKVIRKGEIRL